MTIDVRSYYLK